MYFVAIKWAAGEAWAGITEDQELQEFRSSGVQ
jgi:hypothetical protein